MEMPALLLLGKPVVSTPVSARTSAVLLGFAHLKVGNDTDIDLIDMRGHENFCAR